MYLPHWLCSFQFASNKFEFLLEVDVFWIIIFFIIFGIWELSQCLSLSSLVVVLGFKKCQKLCLIMFSVGCTRGFSFIGCIIADSKSSTSKYICFCGPCESGVCFWWLFKLSIKYTHYQVFIFQTGLHWNNSLSKKKTS